jgi:hypothetical protein
MLSRRSPVFRLAECESSSSARLAGLLAAAVLACSCGGPERRPRAAQSERVTELLHSAGPGVRDCGEALEARDETQCRVKPVGECVESALKDCRPGHGVRSYFTPEGDSVRVDWLVLSDGAGGCVLVEVEDRSADPLAKKTPAVRRCESMVWRLHESIRDCESPVLANCKNE